MDNELMRYATGEVKPRSVDRRVAVQARHIYEETQLAGFKADGVMALAGHMMEGLVMLDARRQSLSQGDPVTDVVLSEIEANTVRQLKQLQNDLGNGWRM